MNSLGWSNKMVKLQVSLPIKANVPIIGANVIVKGSSIGSISDMNGHFSLDASEKDILLISYIGYMTKEVKIGKQRSLKIQLTEDTQNIDEVVVIGYGSVKKSDLTGAVSSVKTAELQQTPMTSIDQGLVGRASGVQVIQTSGMPGAVALFGYVAVVLCKVETSLYMLSMVSLFIVVVVSVIRVVRHR